MKIWDVNFNNIVISKLVKTKINSKYLIGSKFDKAVSTLVLIISKMSGYVKTFKVKEGDLQSSLLTLCLDIKAKITCKYI